MAVQDRPDRPDRPNLVDEPLDPIELSDNGGRSSDNASRKWTVRTVIHRLCRVLITRGQLLNEPQAKPTSVLDLRRANAQTVGQLEAFELVRTTETQCARREKQSVI